MRSLADEYQLGATELRPFFRNLPDELWTSPRLPVVWDPSLAAELRSRNADLGVTAEIPERAVPIVTGQQPGLFTGPLYTVYKAVTALNLSRRLEERTGTPHVPVFWLGSDDHDFEEARSAGFLGKDHEPFTLRYEPSTPVVLRPMFKVPLDESLHAFVDEIAERTPGSEFRDEVAGFLHESLRASGSFSEWTARMLAYLFRDTPMLFIEPRWDAARRLASAVIRREVENPLYTTALINESGARLQSLGYTQQVVKASDECNFFLIVGNQRCKVLFREGRFLVPETDRRFSPGELLSLLNDDPTCFSPNVALRCAVQQQVLGPAAYVAGPGETAYWAQLRPVFEHLELEMPVVYPRAQAVLTSIKLNKLRNRLGLSLEDVQKPSAALVEGVLRRTHTTPALQVLRERRVRVEGEARALSEALAGQDQSAAPLSGGFVKRVSDDLDRLERALLLADESQRQTLEKQVQRLCNSLAPWRKPQERVYTAFSFVFQQGPGFIRRLSDELDPEFHGIHEVEL